MKKIIFFLLFVQFILIACDKDEVEAPKFSSFSPVKEGPGIEVVLNGAFQALKGVPIVKFNDANAEVLIKTNSTILVVIPEDASTGKITITSNGVTLTSDQDFEITTGRWKQKQNFPGGPIIGATSFVINDKVYVVGGLEDDGTTAIKNLWQYDPILDSWIEKASLPLVKEGAKGVTSCGVVILNNIAYLAGGSSGGVNKEVWKYNPALDEWTQLTDLPINDDHDPAYMTGVALDGKGYFFTISKVYEYNPADDSWTNKTNIPEPFRGRNFIVLGQDIYLMNTENSWTDNWKWSPVNNEWTKIPVFTEENTINCPGIDINNKGYVFFRRFGTAVGEVNTTGGRATECWEYDPETNAWLQKTSNPIPRGGSIGFSFMGKGYLLGGASYGGPMNYLDDVWEFTP